jgi:hypothetical protein
MARLFDILTHNAPPHIRDWWDKSHKVIADSIQSMVDREKDFAYFRNGSDFVLFPPMKDFVIEGESEITGGIQAATVEVFPPDEAFMAMRYFGSKQGIPDNTKWAYFINCFMAHRNRRIPVTTFHQATVYVDDQGNLIRPHVGGEMELICRPEHLQALRPYQALPDDQVSALLSASIRDTINIASMIMFVITIMNCKNVELVEEVPNLNRAARRRVEKGMDSPSNVYKVLRVKRSKKQLERLEAETGHTGRKLRYHFRRGYPVTYSEDAPAFGKSWGVGTFFVESMWKGGLEQGEVEKVYQVEGD